MQSCQPTHSDNPKEEKPPETNKKPVTLRFSVFFDGTGNNRGNIQARQGTDKDGQKVYRLLQKQAPVEKGQPKGIGSAVASFEADFSNIALMEEQFKKSDDADYQASIYVEGIGTRDLQKVAKEYEADKQMFEAQMETMKYAAMYGPSGAYIPPRPPKVKVDSVVGGAMARGSTGLYEKIDSGMSKLLDEYTSIVELNNFSPETHEIKKITIDVFGFSRGAATARCFVDHLSSGVRNIGSVRRTLKRIRKFFTEVPYPTLIKRMVDNEGISVAEDALKVEFAGLFDTVSSHGSALHSDVDNLKLNAIKNVEKTYHLAAAEEHRLCFSLTDIGSAKNGEEYYLPGVHSDIGGGYREEGAEEDNFDLLDRGSLSMLGLNLTSHGMNFSKYAATIKREGWYQNPGEHNSVRCQRDWQIKVKAEKTYITGPMGMYGQWIEQDTAVKAHRCKISNDYRLIPLNLMAEETEKNGVHFKPRLKSANKVPGELIDVDNAIRNYIGRIGGKSHRDDWFKKSSEQIGEAFVYEDLRNKYLHYSSRIDTGHWPRLKKGERYREVYEG